MFGTELSFNRFSLTGDSIQDTLLLLTVITAIGALAALRAAFRRSGDDSKGARGKRDTGATQGDSSVAVAGRLERLEKNLSEFRTETLRSLELLRMQLDRDRSGTASSAKAVASGSEKSSVDTHDNEFLTPSGPGQLEDSTEPAPATEVETQDMATNTEAPIHEAVKDAPASLASRLKSTRRGLFDRLRSVFSSKPKLDEESVEELRALLIGADLGVKTVESVIGLARAELQRGEVVDEDRFRGLVHGALVKILSVQTGQASAPVSPDRVEGKPRIVLVVGVNGAGKTTTVAKLAHQLTQQGAKVLLVAADTFRAAAVAQLSEWAQRLKVPVVTGPENAKPQTVIFDAMERLSAEPFDVVLIDTAGRLQTKLSLMQELEGVRNAISRHQAGAPHETLLVLDGSTGQNAVSQAREFNDATPLTGMVITKLDGTPKGGVVVAIADEFGIPVRYIGVGESPTDLRPFIASDFVEALLHSDSADEQVDESKVLSIHSAHAEQRRRRRAAS